MYSAPISLGTVLTDDHGEFSIDVVVPPTLIGEHSIAIARELCGLSDARIDELQQLGVFR